MAKESEPTSPGGGENPVGNLSEYVSTQLDAIALKKAEEAASRERGIEELVHRADLARPHLLELARPMDELLQRFRVNELLKEAQDNFWKQGVIKKIQPLFDIVIVSEPELIRSKPDLARYFLDYLPSCRFLTQVDSILRGVEMRSDAARYGFVGGYGLGLERTIRTEVPRLVWHTFPGYTRWLGPGGGDIHTPGGAFWQDVEGNVQGTVRQTITVEVVTPKGQVNTYGLLYRYRETRVDVNPVFDLHFSGSKRIILADESPDVLKQTIGNQIVKGLDH